MVTCGVESEHQGDNRAVTGERVSRKLSVARVLCCKRSCCDKNTFLYVQGPDLNPSAQEKLDSRKEGCRAEGCVSGSIGGVLRRWSREGEYGSREAQTRTQTLKDYLGDPWGVLSREGRSTLYNLSHLVGTDCWPARCGQSLGTVPWLQLPGCAILSEV